MHQQTMHQRQLVNPQCRPHQTPFVLPHSFLTGLLLPPHASCPVLCCPSAAFSSKAGTQRISRGAEAGTQSSAPASPFDFFKKKEGTQVVKSGGRADAGTGAGGSGAAAWAIC